MNWFPIVPVPPMTFHIPGLGEITAIHYIIAPLTALALAVCGTIGIIISGSYRTNPRTNPMFHAYLRSMVKDGLRMYAAAAIILMFGIYPLVLITGVVAVLGVRGFFRGMTMVFARG